MEQETIGPQLVEIAARKFMRVPAGMWGKEYTAGPQIRALRSSMWLQGAQEGSFPKLQTSSRSKRLKAVYRRTNFELFGN